MSTYRHLLNMDTSKFSTVTLVPVIQTSVYRHLRTLDTSILSTVTLAPAKPQFIESLSVWFEHLHDKDTQICSLGVHIKEVRL